MNRRLVSMFLGAALLAAPALSNPKPASGGRPPVAAVKALAPVVQTRVNFTLDCQDLSGAAQRLGESVRQCQGMVLNLNVNENGNGNANLRLPPGQLDAFMASCRQLGTITNQNINTSDNTRSYEEACRNLALMEKMAQVQWVPQGKSLTAEERLLLDAELKSYIKDRINSYRNNVTEYESSRSFAEVSINLTGPAAAARPNHRVRHRQEPVSDPVAPPQPAAVSDSGSHTNWATLILPGLFLVVSILYFTVGLLRRSKPANQG